MIRQCQCHKPVFVLSCVSSDNDDVRYLRQPRKLKIEKTCRKFWVAGLSSVLWKDDENSTSSPLSGLCFLTKSQFYVGMPFFLYCARELIQVSSGIGVGILTIKLLLLTKWVSTDGELMLNLSWHLEVMFIHFAFFEVQFFRQFLRGWN
jgi:hypothetical protein